MDLTPSKSVGNNAGRIQISPGDPLADNNRGRFQVDLADAIRKGTKIDSIASRLEARGRPELIFVGSYEFLEGRESEYDPESEEDKQSLIEYRQNA